MIFELHIQEENITLQLWQIKTAVDNTPIMPNYRSADLPILNKIHQNNMFH